MDMKLLDNNVIECIIPMDELDSRWNASVEDIILGNEKGKSVVDFLVAQSIRKFDISPASLYQIDMTATGNGMVKFSIKWGELDLSQNGYNNLMGADCEYFGEENVCGTSDMEGNNIEGTIGADTQNSPGSFPVVCYGYKFRSMCDVISACSVISFPECISSLCKEKQKYILLITMEKHKGDAILLLLSEFTEESLILYSKDNVADCKSVHETVMERYSPENVIIDTDAVGKLSDINR